MCATSQYKLLILSLSLTTLASARADEDAVIDQAVKRGITHLRSIQGPDGAWTQAGHSMGPTALAGLAMLECGVKQDDPALRRALDYVRDGAAGNESIPGASQTYDISLAILFLDRFGSARDIPLIESLTVRLMAGQNSQGGWGYTCPTINADEIQRLRQVSADTPDKQRTSQKRPGVEDLPREIQRQIKQIEIVQPAGNPGGGGDNSNTQFATLGLWVGRRHGLPVELALARIEQRYRTSQNADGGWGYQAVLNASRDTMTCAGLLGLAAAYGYAIEKETRKTEKDPKKQRKQPADLTKDVNVRAGLIALGTVIGTPINGPIGKQANPGNLLNLNPPVPGAFPAPANLQLNYYLLWSIERVAMAFDLQKINQKDWYRWGVQLILSQQRPDGSWTGQYGGGGVDTCFALFFLRRSNLAQDLTANLRGRVRDPGEARLHAGEFVPSKTEPTKPALTIDLKIPGTFESTDADQHSPAAILSQELIKATLQTEAAILDKLRDSKGLIYTEALASAIPRVTGARKTKARDALASRLTRMSASTLHDKFKDPSAEIRRAAILAAAMNEDKSFVPDILALLNDPAPSVWHAAPVAFRRLTGKDLEIVTTSTPMQREQARKKWEAWWNQNGQK
jgi:hypothetical protein